MQSSHLPQYQSNPLAPLLALCDALAKFYVENNKTPELMLHDLFLNLSEGRYDIILNNYLKNCTPYFHGTKSSDRDRKFYKKLANLYNCPSIPDLDEIKASSTFVKFFKSNINRPTRSKEDYIVRVIRHLRKQHTELFPSFFTDLLTAFFSLFSHYRIYFNNILDIKLPYVSMYEKTLTNAIEDHQSRMYLNEAHEPLLIRDYELFNMYPSYLYNYQYQASAILTDLIKSRINVTKIKHLDLNSVMLNKDRVLFLNHLLTIMYISTNDHTKILNNISNWITKDLLEKNPNLNKLIQDVLYKHLDIRKNTISLELVYFLNDKFDLISEYDKEKLMVQYRHLSLSTPIPDEKLKMFVKNIKTMKPIDLIVIKNKLFNKLVRNDVVEVDNTASCERNFAYLMLKEFVSDLSKDEYDEIKKFLLANLFKTQFNAENFFILKALPTFLNNLDENESKQLGDFYNQLITFITTSSISYQLQNLIDAFHESSCMMLKKLNIKIDKTHIDQIIHELSIILNKNIKTRSINHLNAKIVTMHISFIKYYIHYQLINDENIKYFTLKLFNLWESFVKALKQNNKENITFKNILVRTLIGYSDYLPTKESNALLKHVLNLMTSNNYIERERQGLESITTAIKEFDKKIKLFSEQHYFQIIQVYIQYYTTHNDESKILYKNDIPIFTFLFNSLSHENQMKIYLMLYLNIRQKENYRSIKFKSGIGSYYNRVNDELLLDCAYHLAHYNGNLKSLPYTAIKCIDESEKGISKTNDSHEKQEIPSIKDKVDNNVATQYNRDKQTEMKSITNKEMTRYRPGF